MCLAQAADIFGTGLVAGASIMGAFAVHPAAAKLDAWPHIALRRELIRRLQRFLPPLMLLPILASIMAPTSCRTPVSRFSDSLGCALSLVTVGITLAVNGPLNRRFASWSPSTVPLDWKRHVGRWNAAHSIRMATSVGAFACAILAVN